MKRRILVLCTGNSARSQMAEGLLRHLGGIDLEVFSAGTAPGKVHPMAVTAMSEIGIDITAQWSKHLGIYLEDSFDDVLTVCDSAAESCPVFPGQARRTHWSLPDPAATEGDEMERLDSFRMVRRMLERRLPKWLEGPGQERDSSSA